jgi:cytochrome oxidase Cu insertion factor (SCO1/SenC/PrrC family)
MDKMLLTILGIGMIGLLTISGIVVYNQFFDPVNQIELREYYYTEDFTLTTHKGEPFTLSSSDGTIRVLTFIFTACTWGCSTITFKMAQAFDILKEQGYDEKITFIEIVFDYIYDNATTIANHINLITSYSADTIPDNYLFLHGNEEEITSVTDSWNYFIKYVNETDHDNDHDHIPLQPLHDDHDHIDWIHAFIVYVIDKDGMVRKFITGTDWDIDLLVNTVKAIDRRG